MGRHRAKLMAGSAAATGFTSPPLVTDFSLALNTATSENITRIAGFPPTADRWTVIVVDALTGAITFQNTALGSPINATGLTTGRVYRVYMAWAVSGSLQRVSDWSPPQSFTAGS